MQHRFNNHGHNNFFLTKRVNFLKQQFVLQTNDLSSTKPTFNTNKYELS